MNMLSLKCFRPGGDCFEDPEWKKSCLKMDDVDANELEALRAALAAAEQRADRAESVRDCLQGAGLTV